jgi:predicted nucleic acid-binding protein
VGLILDSSAAVTAERRGMNAKQLLGSIESQTEDDEIAISVVTLMELAHGVVRADGRERRDKRQRFLDELMSAVPPHGVTLPVALRAGRIDGHSQAKGLCIPLSDLLIGATALELEYAVATHNVRHFRLIPDLIVKPL